MSPLASLPFGGRLGSVVAAGIADNLPTWLREWLATDAVRQVGQLCLLALAGLILTRVVRAATRRLDGRLDRTSEGELVTPENIKQRRSLLTLLSWALIVSIWTVTVLSMLAVLHLNLAAFVAPATAIGAAVGFGSQQIVRDLLAGFFIITESQFAVGDIVRIGPLGTEAGVSGTVEALTLRTTRLRTVSGDLVTISNGDIRQVANLSRDWSQVVIDIPLAPDVDVDAAADALGRIGREMRADAAWRPLLLADPDVVGVQSISAEKIEIRLLARTLPSKQWAVGRELRRRITQAFADAGVELKLPPVAGGPDGA